MNYRKHNQLLIKKFLKFLKASGYSKRRMTKYSYNLPKISKWLGKAFDKADTDDMIRLMGKIEEMDYTDWTKVTYRALIKRFWKWLNGDKDYPDCVRFIKTGMKKANNKLPDDMLTKEDIDALVNSAQRIRDKAFVRVLYESGCRISELLSLRIKHVSFDNYSPILIISNGKTGGRRVRIIDKDGLLKQWIKSHPLKHDPDSYLFISVAKNKKNMPLRYQSVTKILRKLKKKSGVTKAVNPHNFRHSRATHLAGKLTEPQMRMLFGWSMSSKMPEVYVHLSGRDIDESILKISGLLEDQEKDIEKIDTLAVDFIKMVLESAEKNPKLKSKLGRGLQEIIRSRGLQKLF